jgi:hypothetical protein
MNNLGDMEVGSVVYLRVDGEYEPFRVMHHGKPSASYDDSFVGGTILCKDYEGEAVSVQMVTDADGGKVSYAGSLVHQMLNQNWLSKLEPAIQQAVMEVKLPYRTDTDGEPYVVAEGSSGLATKVWLPSLSEITQQVQYEEGIEVPYVQEGALFGYWKNAESTKYRKWACLNYSGNDVGWGTRTPSVYTGVEPMAACFFRVSMHGYAYTITGNTVDVWPCLVMPDSLAVDDAGHLHLVGAVPVKVNGTWMEGSTWCCVNGAWNEAAALAVKTAGSWKE